LQRHAGDGGGAFHWWPLASTVAGGPLLVGGLTAYRHQLPPFGRRCPRISSARAYGLCFPFRLSHSRRPTAVSPSSIRRASSRARSATSATPSCFSRSWRRAASAPLSVRYAW